MRLKLAELISKIILKIQRQIYQTLQVFERRSQSSEALICNFGPPIF
jgi:hypothetical protein